MASSVVGKIPESKEGRSGASNEQFSVILVICLGLARLEEADLNHYVLYYSEMS